MKIKIHYSSMRNISFKGTLDFGSTDDWSIPEDLTEDEMLALIEADPDFSNQVLEALVDLSIELEKE